MPQFNAPRLILALAAALALLAAPAQAASPGVAERLGWTGFDGDIHTAPADASAAGTALPDDGAFSSFGSFSADGRKLVYEAADAGESRIVVANADGSSPVYITPAGTRYHHPQFSPDGTRITAQRIVAAGGHVVVMDADGTDEVDLSAARAGSLGDFPTFSPDGTRIAYVDYLSGQESVRSMSAVNGTDNRLLFGPISQRIGGPDFTPDGLRVVFPFHNAGVAATQVASVAASGAADQRVVVSSGVLLNRVAVAPEGGRVAYVTDNYSIRAVALDGLGPVTHFGAGHAPTWLADPDPIAPTTTDDVPATYRTSPIRVTLTASDNTGGSGVASIRYRIVSAAGTAGSELTYDAASKPTLADGEKIEYRAIDNDGNAEIAKTSREAVVAPATNFFSAATAGSTGDGPRGVAVGDLNGDGRRDIATANFGADTVTVTMRNAADTGWEAPETLASTGDSPTGIEIADLDGDGRNDIATGDTLGDSITIFRRNAAGTGWETPATLATGDHPLAIVASDVDGDGDTDLVTANNAASTVSVIRRSGGSWASPVHLAAGQRVVSVAVGDLDGDGVKDLATAGTLNGAASVRMLKGTGSSWNAATAVGAAGEGTSDLVIADLTGDGRNDVATADATARTVTVIARNAAGTGWEAPTAPVTMETGSPKAIVAADFNGDGRTDLATSNYVDYVVMVLTRNAAGTGWDAPRRFRHTGFNAIDLRAADMTGDGRPDVVTVNNASDETTLMTAIHDPSAPTTTSNVPSTHRAAAIAVTLTATDTGGSGLERTTYEKIAADGTVGDTETYSASAKPTLTDGESLRYRSVDKAGNLEADKTSLVAKVDTEKPATTDDVPATYRTASIPVTLTASDPGGSGVATIKYRKIAPDGTQGSELTYSSASKPSLAHGERITFYATDGVGNVEAAKTSRAAIVFANATNAYVPSTPATISDPRVLAVGDLNGDGRPDIATASYLGPALVTVFLRTADGAGWESPVSLGSGGVQNDLEIGDLNGDGLADLAVVNASGHVRTFTRKATNDGWDAPVLAATIGSGSDGIALGDFTGDGRTDIAASDTNNDRVMVAARNALNTGWAPPAVAAATGDGPGSLDAGDLDGDGRLDLAVGNATSRTVTFLVRNAAGDGWITTSSAQLTVATKLVVGDLNADGRADVAVPGGGRISVLMRNAANDGFDAAVTTPSISGSPFPLGIGDVNGDGRNDLVSGNLTAANVSVVTRNASNNGWNAPTNHGPTGTAPRALQVADMTGEGRPDIVVASSQGNSITLLTAAHDGTPPTTTDDVPATYRTSPVTVTLTATDAGGSGVGTIRYRKISASGTVGTLTTYNPASKPTLANGEKLRYSTTDNAGNVEADKTSRAATVVPATNFFTQATAGAVGAEPAGIATGDLNGDGRLDLAVSNAADDDVSVLYKNAGAGYTKRSADLLAGDVPTDVGIEDMNGDGSKDILVAGENSAQVAVFYGDPSAPGEFTRVNVSTGTTPSLEIGDVNADGRPDIITANRADGDVSILLKNATGTGFTRQTPDLPASAPEDAAVGDANGDGRADIAVANVGSNSVTVYTQTTAGGFEASMPEFQTGTHPQSVELADLGGDGRAEVIAANAWQASITVYETTTFTRLVADLPTGTGPYDVVAADLTGDGRPDLATANAGSDDVTVYATNGTGTGFTRFGADPRVPFGGPVALAAGDLDADGRPDLATADYQTDGVSVLTAAHDGTAPAASTDDVPAGAAAAPFSVTLSATDTGGSGVASIRYRIVSAGGADGEEAVYSASSKPQLRKGERIKHWGVDAAGNAGTTTTSRALVTDATPPATTDDVPATYRTVPIPVTLTATDNAGGSGVASIKYRIVSAAGAEGAELTYNPASRPTLSDGERIRYFATDVDGNAETPRTSRAAVVAAPTNYFVPSLARVSGNTVAIASGDLDGDGRLDLATTDANDRVMVTTRKSDNSGWNTPVSAGATGVDPAEVAVGDLNGDGRNDIAVADRAEDRVTVILRTAQGTWDTPVSAGTTADQPSQLAIADVTGDALPDLVAAGVSTGSATVIARTAANTAWEAPQAVALGATSYVTDLAVGDLDGDGRRDLAVTTNSSAAPIRIVTRTALGGWNASTTVGSIGGAGAAFAIADLDADGRNDLAVANGAAPSALYAVIRRTDNTGFAAPTLLGSGPTNSWVQQLAVGDLSGDGLPDVAAANSNTVPGSVTVVTRDAANTGWDPRKIHPGNSWAYQGVTMGDADADGRNDLLAASYFEGVSVLTAAHESAPPVTTDDVPDGLRSSVTVTLGATDAGGSGVATTTYEKLDASGKVIGTTQTYSSGAKPTLADGERLRYRSTDVAGNVEADRTSNAAQVDAVAPVTADDVPAGYRTGPIAVTLSATDDGGAGVGAGGIKYRIVTAAGAEGAEQTYDPASKPTLGNGQKIKHHAVDTVGNPGTPKTSRAAVVEAATNWFAPAKAGDTQAAPHGMDVGDLNGDGRPDLAVANASSDSVTVMLKNPSGTGYTASKAGDTGATPHGVAIGDFNADGRPDIAAVNRGGNSVTVLYKDAAGAGYTATNAGSTGANPESIAVGDLDGDGDLDMATADSTSNRVTLIRKDDTGLGFTASNAGTANGTPVSVAIGDLTGDGKADIAAVGATGVVTVLRNDGATFSSSAAGHTGAGGSWIAIADFDGDGRADLATADDGRPTVSVFYRQSNGSYTRISAGATGTRPLSVATGDVNGDGRPDLIASNYNADTATVLLKDATGTGFTAGTSLSTGDGPYEVVAADLDADGRTDLATANHLGTSITVLTAGRDDTPPVTTDNVPAGAAPVPFPVRLTATDGESGPGTIRYTKGVDPADPVTSGAVYDPNDKPTLAAGERIRYYAVDRTFPAGNAEAAKTSSAMVRGLPSFDRAFGHGTTCTAATGCSAGNGSTAAGRLNGAASVAVSGDEVYALDRGNNRVNVFSMDGTHVRTISGGLSLPLGVAVSGGEVYVADFLNSRIAVFTTAGTFVRSIGSHGAGAGQMNGPHDVAVSGGHVYALDNGNGRVVVFTTGGVYVRTMGSIGNADGQFSYPNGLDVDAGAGEVFVADSSRHRVSVFTTTGTFVRAFGTSGTGAGNLKGPTDVAIGGGFAYVADEDNRRISVFTRSGSFVRAFAKGVEAGGDDAMACTTTCEAGASDGAAGALASPTKLAVSKGEAFVADLTNHRISVFDLAEGDAEDPTIAIASPAANAEIPRFSTTTPASFSCADETALASCTATLDGEPISSGAALPTATVGAKTLTVTATDEAGNTATASRTYQVLGEAVVRDAGCLATQVPTGGAWPGNTFVTLPQTVEIAKRPSEAAGTELRSSAWVSEDGILMFNTAGYTPPVADVFFGNNTMTAPGANRATYGTTTFGGRPAFCANWTGSDYRGMIADGGAFAGKRNSFQVLLVDRSDVAPNDFDLIYNVDQIEWQESTSTTRTGFWGNDVDFDEPGFAGEGFLDSKATALSKRRRGGSTVDGRLRYAFRDGRMTFVRASQAAGDRLAAPEGSAITVTGAFATPDGDAPELSADETEGTFTDNGDGTWAWTHTPTDEQAAKTVTVTATDQNGEIATDDFAYSVANVAPSVTFAGEHERTYGEGALERSFSYTASDAGGGDALTFTPSCGTGGVLVSGSSQTSATGGSFRCTFADGPATPDVTVTATDGDGGSGSDTVDVTVANVAPTVAFTGASTRTFAEGATQRTLAYTISDPGDDGVGSVATSCGPGTKVAGSDTHSAGGGSFACVFADGPASGDATAAATDSDGAAGSTARVGVSVENVAPVVAFSGPATTTVPESGSAERTFSFTIADAGDDTVSSVATGCGANGTKVSGSDAHTNTGGSFRCVFPDGPATSTVTASATDSDGATSSTDGVKVDVTVENVSPTLAFDGPGSVTFDESGAKRTFTYSVSDPGADTATVEASCGSAGTISDEAAGSFACRFGDGDASSTVSARATDGDGARGEADTVGVTVENVAPAVTFDGAATRTVDESGAAEHEFTYAIADPGDDTVSSVATSCGTGGVKVAGSDAHTSTGGSLRCRFPDGPASPEVSARATDSDGDQGAADTIAVTVRNTTPTVTFDDEDQRTYGEGASERTFSYTAVDAGGDTLTFTPSCGSAGVVVDGSAETAAASGSFRCTFADGPATSDVKVTAAETGGASGDDTVHVTVANVAPTLAFDGAATRTVDESGTTEHAFTYAIADPGTDTVRSVATSCGTGGSKVTGSDANTDTGGSFRCRFPSGPASPVVSARATDTDGDEGAADTIAVTVRNGAPTVTFAGEHQRTYGEGALERSFSYSATDGGGDALTFTPSCGTGGVLVSGSSQTTASGGSFRCTFADGPAAPTVRVTAIDADGAAASDTIAVTVANAAPVVTFAGAPTRTVAEGADERTFSYTVGDPGDDAVASVSTSCGGNGTKVAGSDAYTSTGGSFACVFRDGPATSTVTATATDSDGATSASDSVKVEVTVANVAPTLTFDGPASVAYDESPSAKRTFTYTLSDPGDDTIAVQASCGSGGTISDETRGSFACVFADGPATPTVTATPTDSDGGAGAADSIAVTVRDVAPVVAFAPVATTHDESGTAERTFGYTIGGGGAVSSVATSCGTGGEKVPGSDANTDSGGSFRCRFPDGPASPTLTAQATDGDGSAGEAATLGVTVTNVAPTLTSIVAPSAETPVGTSRSWAFAGTDPSPADQAALAFAVDWGDGTTTTAASPLSHAYAVPGDLVVTARARDKDGALSAADARIQRVAGTGLVPARAGIPKTLTVAGTTAADEVWVGREGSKTVVVKETGETTRRFTMSSNMEIVITGGAGNDEITVDDRVIQKAMVFGNAGNDSIDVQNAAAVVVGGTGSDVLSSDRGRDLLIGGEGADELDAGNGGDILVAGRVPWQDGTLASRKTLRAFRGDWNAKGADYETRLTRLTVLQRGRTAVLDGEGPGQTVFDDAARDALVGDDGDDWFLANVSDGSLDTTDEESGEVETDLD